MEKHGAARASHVVCGFCLMQASTNESFVLNCAAFHLIPTDPC